MFSDGQLSTSGVARGDQPISSQAESLQRDDIGLRLLVVLNLRAKASSQLLISLVNRDKPVKIPLDEMLAGLSRLEQIGYIAAQRYTRSWMVWKRPLATPLYTITPGGKAALEAALATTNRASTKKGDQTIGL